MEHLVETVHQSCVEINTISKWTERASIWPTLPRRSAGYTQNNIHAHGAFVVNRASISPGLTPSPCKLKRPSTWPYHLGVPSGAPKMIFKPIASSAQIVRISCVEISTISEETKMSINLTHITKEFYHLPKTILSLRYVHPNPCTYLARD
jgi:hypothetical protein